MVGACGLGDSCNHVGAPAIRAAASESSARAQRGCPDRANILATISEGADGHKAPKRPSDELRAAHGHKVDGLFLLYCLAAQLDALARREFAELVRQGTRHGLNLEGCSIHSPTDSLITLRASTLTTCARAAVGTPSFGTWSWLSFAKTRSLHLTTG